MDHSYYKREKTGTESTWKRGKKELSLRCLTSDATTEPGINSVTPPARTSCRLDLLEKACPVIFYARDRRFPVSGYRGQENPARADE